MINYEKAKTVFIDYVSQFGLENKKVKHKLEHTFHVVDNSEYLARKLNLTDENIQLAKLIALLHDIGRFEQAIQYENFRDYQTIDHADLGRKLLLTNGKIRDYVEDSQFDSIIEQAILNHNKYELLLDSNYYTDQILLQCKIIRDSDKMDSFRAKTVDDIYTMANITEDEIENSLITDSIYECFMNKKTIISKDRKTPADIWISYLAFLFDFNFSVSLEWIKENDYVNQLIDRFDYKVMDTKEKMENIRNFSLQYIDSRIQEGE